MSAEQPSIAVIIPAYHSEQTIAASLESLAYQGYPSVQLVVVESEPRGAVAELIRSKFPAVTYIPVKGRLLPHAARNLGVQNCDAGLLLFTDPDIYVPPGWVAGMLAAHQRYGGVIAGSVNNATQRWLDWGIHLSKFDLFLPMGKPHPWQYCATGNMLCSRKDFEQVGGFDGDEMLGDLLISWKFAHHRIPITYVPQPAVRHHHIETLHSFLRERFVRGQDFGRLRKGYSHWSRSQALRHLLVTVSGLRLVNLVLRTAVNARRARRFGWFAAALPLVVLGHGAWLLGEARSYAK